jgi:pyruvate/2-oxoglutarate/acetoin dehydrogenase E1 component
MRPVVEIMFGDFTTLMADQVINHAAKFRWMYNDQVRVPLVIRTPMGGGRGYGPTHSQSLEKLFLGVPGLKVLAATDQGDPGALLAQAVLHGDDPVLFVEHKLLYQAAVLPFEGAAEFEIETLLAGKNGQSAGGGAHEGADFPPTFRLRILGAPPAHLTMAAYGYMATQARAAALELAYKYEVFCDLLVPTQLAPGKLSPVLESLASTQRLLVVEEGSRTLGWGAEVAAQAAEVHGPRLRAVRRLAAQETPIPASQPLEAAALPGVAGIVAAARQLVLE